MALMVIVSGLNEKKRKILVKVLHASMKTLTNSGDFTGSCLRIPPPPPKQDWQQLKGNCEPNSSFEKSESIVRL
jgi:hypothetical protein